MAVNVYSFGSHDFDTLTALMSDYLKTIPHFLIVFTFILLLRYDVQRNNPIFLPACLPWPRTRPFYWQGYSGNPWIGATKIRPSTDIAPGPL